MLGGRLTRARLPASLRTAACRRRHPAEGPGYAASRPHAPHFGRARVLRHGCLPTISVIFLDSFPGLVHDAFMSQPLPLTPALPDVADRLAGIVEALRRAVAARASRRWAFAPLALLLWPYLHGIAVRFDRLATRLRQGRVRARSPRPTAARTDAPTRTKPRSRLLPRGWAWLIRAVPDAAGYGSQLRHLLAQPEMISLLEAAPQAGRMLRPLCRALGIGPSPDVPAALFPPRPPPTTKPPIAEATSTVPPSTVPPSTVPPSTVPPSTVPPSTVPPTPLPSWAWPKPQGRRAEGQAVSPGPAGPATA